MDKRPIRRRETEALLPAVRRLLGRSAFDIVPAVAATFVRAKDIAAARAEAADRPPRPASMRALAPQSWPPDRPSPSAPRPLGPPTPLVGRALRLLRLFYPEWKAPVLPPPPNRPMPPKENKDEDCGHLVNEIDRQIGKIVEESRPRDQDRLARNWIACPYDSWRRHVIVFLLIVERERSEKRAAAERRRRGRAVAADYSRAVAAIADAMLTLDRAFDPVEAVASWQPLRSAFDMVPFVMKPAAIGHVRFAQERMRAAREELKAGVRSLSTRVDELAAALQEADRAMPLPANAEQTEGLTFVWHMLVWFFQWTGEVPSRSGRSRFRTILDSLHDIVEPGKAVAGAGEEPIAFTVDQIDTLLQRQVDHPLWREVEPARRREPLLAELAPLQKGRAGEPLTPGFPESEAEVVAAFKRACRGSRRDRVVIGLLMDQLFPDQYQRLIDELFVAAHLLKPWIDGEAGTREDFRAWAAKTKTEAPERWRGIERLMGRRE